MAQTPPERLVIGNVSRPHGILGEIKVQLAPEYAGALAGVRRVYLNDAEKAYRVRGYREHQGAALLKLEHVSDRNAAEALRGARVAIALKDLPELPTGEYYAHQLIGLRVVRDGDGQLLGQVAEVLATGSNDVYVVKRDGGEGELLLPAIESVIRAIDMESGKMLVVVPDGLE